YMKPDQVSLAIGKGGNNIRLASRLTGYEIDVYRDDEEYDEEDVNLDEFNDEFDQWVIDAFKAIGCDTAKGVLKLSREDLIQRTDLEEETVDEMIASIKKELDIE
ncbi:MAG TPA: transcription termination/antitermination protein NusA, partial [Bacteroidales bacterium]|nr:transcription termination/antitermination protein NusA [Bacteroidales bacterium]